MKKAIVIGASSGIGRALAKSLAGEGYTVGITGRRRELLEKISNEVPGRFVVSSFDVTSGNATGLLDSLIDKLGGLDLLILSSGTGHLNPELDVALEEDTNTVNIEAFTRIVGHTYSHFERQGQGHLVCITSVMGLRGSSAAPSYAASKAYQINYLEGLRQRAFAGGRKITVTDIRPGSVDTDMMKGEGHFWVSTPEQAASYIMRAIRKRKAVQYATPRWKTLAGLLKVLPRWVHKRM